jgi:type I restriction-modification system DNA methylase subunit
MTNEEFKRTLWEAADKLSGSVSAAEYKYPVLGLVFLKYVLDMYDAQAQANRHRVLDGQKQIQSVIDLRNLLLPRLISGRLRLSETASMGEMVPA